MYDIIIKGGKVYDGMGTKPYFADIAIKDGTIAEIGKISASSKQEIAADGMIVTPGFIDIHTHYDGQISWDEELKPSVNHGVTTIVMGNCGVGFAPCRKQDRDKLIRLMEGVEDIPGTALHEGLSWEWESFPEYMDALEAMPHTIDFMSMVPHDPLRVFVMGERAICEEKASEDDIEKMRMLTREALLAGAVGFSTGRSDAHRSMDGQWTPASEADAKELAGIAKAFDGLDFGVLHAVNDFDQERIAKQGDKFDEEFDVLEAFFKAAPNHKASITWMQRDLVPDHWRRIMKRAEILQKQGIDLRLQAACRGIGLFLGLQSTFHPLMAFPSYLEIADLDFAARYEAMRQPGFLPKILAETPVKLAGRNGIPPMTDTMIALTEMISAKMFKLDPDGTGIANYEQGYDSSVHAEAQKRGVSVWEVIYDWMMEDGGKALIYFPIYNYTDMNYNVVREMITHPLALPGLTDGGAHVGYICDASMPSYLLSYWTRDRDAGDRNTGDRNTGDKGKIPLERAVQMLTKDCAEFLGLDDRGVLAVGKKADINIIDYDNLSLGVPKMVKDLPAGGQRLLQPVTGYKNILVAGEIIVENDKLTKARPGKLVRANK